ncbi:MAG: T9SS type A sorting domain-containing protein [Fidelibacterota bacterium]
MQRFLLLILIVPVLAGDAHEFILPKKSGYSINRISDINHIIGVMVEFQTESTEEPDLLTSGSGSFLGAPDTTGFSRCDGFIVDPPPHNQAYFEDQIRAINHYFEHISAGNVSFSFDVIDTVYQVSGRMREYASEDTSLGRLFTEAVELATDKISQIFTPGSIIVVFHAGIGQDFAIPFLDPTPYDLKSAFIDEELFGGITPPIINGYTVSMGIVLPETQNHIFYDVIEEIFYGETDYCDYQVGLTGIFSFMMGYAIGLPPLYNTESGDPGVGVFGLMDHGSNNGRGVIPAPPTAWTRIIKGWDEFDEIHPDTSMKEISTNLIPGQFHEVQKIRISENEYFLIENRNNWVLDEKSIERLRFENPISNFRIGHWFDTARDFMSDEQMIINDETGVIIGFDHYDYGLPGSGLLIWHITEPSIENYMDGINNDREHRAVHLEEADGAVDIGFESYAVFESDDPTRGKIFDMWYAGNSGYEWANPNETSLRFGIDTTPDTRSSSGGMTYYELSDITGSGPTMFYKFTQTEPFPTVALSDEDILILGGKFDPDDQSGMLYYYLHDSIIVRNEYLIDQEYNPSLSGKILYNHVCGSDTLISLEEYENYWFDDNCNLIEENQLTPIGYLNNFDELLPAYGSSSLGDLDLDGLDELVMIENGNISVINNNGTLVNGFPVSGEFFGAIIISNLVGDASPEMICRESNNIVILSSSGNRLYSFASRQPDEDLMIIPFWNSTQMALVDGAKLWLFPVDLEHSYWMFPHGKTDNSAIVSGIHYLQTNPHISLDKNRTYNYPNPITEGVTTFRYYIGQSNSVEIKIYDASGFLVKKLTDSDITMGEYNETVWFPGNINPGLYFAEIKPDNGSSALVRVVYLK